MTLDEFQKAWKAEADQVRISFDAERLAQEVKLSYATFRSMIFWRDTREVVLAFLMLPIWLVMGGTLSLPWTWYLTVPVIVWNAGFLWAYRIRHPQANMEAGEPLSFYVKESLNQLEHQIWLLRNVFWWGLLPPSVSVMAFFVHAGWDSVQSWWGAVIVAAFGGTIVFYLYRWIFRLNQWVVDTQYEPRRDKLRELVARLESDSNSEDFDELLDCLPAWTGPTSEIDSQANWTAWAENWNRIIPSWREVAIIMGPSLLGGYCGWRFAIPEIWEVYFGPTFFQAVVAAVVPFEIAFFSLWYRSYKRRQVEPTANEASPHIAPTTRPKAPALFTIVMIFVMAILAFAALASLSAGQRSRQAVQQSNATPPTQADK